MQQKFFLTLFTATALISIYLTSKDFHNEKTAEYNEEFCNTANGYNYRIDGVYEIRSIVDSSSTEATATGTMAFTVDYYEYEKKENNYYSVYLIEEDGGIKPSRFREENSIFYEDLEDNEEPYVEVCTKSESCFGTQEDLYRIHVPKNTIYKKIEIQNE